MHGLTLYQLHNSFNYGTYDCAIEIRFLDENCLFFDIFQLRTLKKKAIKIYGSTLIIMTLNFNCPYCYKGLRFAVVIALEEISDQIDGTA